MNLKFKLVILLIISLLVPKQKVTAQKPFSKMYDLFGMWESAATVLHYDTNRIVLSGMGINFGVTDSNKYRRTYIWTIDSSLQPSVKCVFGRNGNDFNGMPVLKSPDHTSNLGVYIVDKDTSEYYIVRINDLGDTQNVAKIDAPQDFSSSWWILRGAKLYVFGKDQDDPTVFSTMRVLCADTLGNRIWYKKYTRPYWITSALSTFDNNFLIGGYLIKGTTFNDTAIGWYSKMDTLGNILWEKFLDKKDQYESTNVGVASLNNNYFITSSNDASDQVFPPLVKDTSFLSMFKIDMNGNPIWYKRMISPWKKYVVASEYCEKNGSMYALGNIETTEGWAGSTMYLTLWKFDSSGTLKWQRLFKQWFKDNRPFSLSPVFDGFIICADGKDTTHTTGITDAWVIKTDTNGCVVPGCHLKDGLVQLLDPEVLLTVYPNPANNILNITVIDSRAKLAQVMLYDMLGNEIGKLPMELKADRCAIRTDHLRSGNYFVVIELQSGERAVKKVLVQN